MKNTKNTIETGIGNYTVEVCIARDELHDLIRWGKRLVVLDTEHERVVPSCDFVWIRREARMIGEFRGGYEIDFDDSLGQSWMPAGNVRRSEKVSE